MDVQQRIARLEGLLARVRERRGVSRAPINHGAHAEAAERPETLPPDAYDEVVDLADEDIVEIGDSVPPPQAAALAPASSGVGSEAVLPVREVESGEHLPEAREPEPSERPPARVATEREWPSSVPPKSLETDEQAFELADAAPSEPAPPVEPKKPDFGLDFDDEEEEEPPASSKRPIASSMDEALADAAAREVPLKTPPPESGPQEAAVAPAGAAHGAPDLDEAPPGAAEADQVSAGMPTSAQLGNTLSLEQGGSAHFEVDAPAEAAATPESQPAPSEDFEIRLPQREAAGSYDAKLAPPAEARGELDAHRERAGALAPESAPGDASGVEVIERQPVAAAEVTSVVGAAQRFRPGNFLELLDASLKLGED